MKRLYRLMLISTKIVPWILAIIYLIGTIFSSIGIDLVILSYLGFTSFIPAVYILIASFTFKSCIWHRLPLYFILVNNIVNYIFWTVLGGLSLGWVIVSILFTLALISILGAYFKNKHNEKVRYFKKLSSADNR